MSVIDVRFVDDRIEATDIDLPGSPVRPESLLLGLGSIVEDDDGLSCGANSTFSETDIRAYRYTLDELTDGSWSIVDSPAMVDPEGFRVTRERHEVVVSTSSGRCRGRSAYCRCRHSTASVKGCLRCRWSVHSSST